MLESMASDGQRADPEEAACHLTERREALHARLRDAGSYDIEALAALRNETVQETRRFVAEACDAGELFVVEDGGRSVGPAIVLTSEGQPRPELTAAISVLRAVGEEGWSLWAWLATPSAWLGGAVPAELATHDKNRVTEAARRLASNAA